MGKTWKTQKQRQLLQIRTQQKWNALMPHKSIYAKDYPIF